jgi:hypothetical protein
MAYNKNNLRHNIIPKNLHTMQAFESLLTTLGLYTPVRRFLGFAAITAVAAYAIKPGAMFDEGVSRPWGMFSTEDDPIPGTSIPWWMLAIIVGVVAALFL